MSIYRCAIDRSCSSFEELQERHVVAQGWTDEGDVSFFTEEADISPYIHVMPLWNRTEETLCCLFNILTKSVSAGDIIVATTGATIVGICEIPSHYTYAYLPGDANQYTYAHCVFPVNWVAWSDFCTQHHTLTPRSLPLAQTHDENVCNFIVQNWTTYKNTHSIQIQPPECTERLERLLAERPQKIATSRKHFFQLIHQKESEMQTSFYRNALETGKNLILTGAPGTGKTYLAYEIAYALTGDDRQNHRHIRFCQFHPSYDYTDFVEGLRPTDPDGNGNIRFERQDGTFKAFCKQAILNQRTNFDDAYEALCKELDEKYSKENPLELKTEKNGKSFKVFLNSNGSLSLITSNSNEVQGSLTAEKMKTFLTDTPYKYWGSYFKGVIRYMVESHHLTTMKEKPDQKYVFIIDEINRGDIAKIFGELFFAIDPGYRAKDFNHPQFTVETQYANLIEEQDIFKKGFYVPDNVYIIGTMNDIDRNVESIDFAIRRRFTWLEIPPIITENGVLQSPQMWDDEKRGIPDEYKAKALQYMVAINKAIESTNGLGSSYQLGASYFLKIRDYQGDFSMLWTNHIQSLLKEYLRGLPNADKDFENLKEIWEKVTFPIDETKTSDLDENQNKHTEKVSITNEQ